MIRGSIKLTRFGDAPPWRVSVQFPRNDELPSHVKLRDALGTDEELLRLVYVAKSLDPEVVWGKLRDELVRLATQTTEETGQPLQFREHADMNEALEPLMAMGHELYCALFPSHASLAVGRAFDDIRMASAHLSYYVDALHEWLETATEIELVTDHPGVLPWNFVYPDALDPESSGTNPAGRFWAFKKLEITSQMARAVVICEPWSGSCYVGTSGGDECCNEMGEKHGEAEHPLAREIDEHRIDPARSPKHLMTTELDRRAILYFYGHGMGKSYGGGKEFALVADGRECRTSDLSNYFDHTPVEPDARRSKLVVLNACDTAQPACTDLGRKIVATLAAGRVNELHVISTLAPVPCWAAYEFGQMLLKRFLGEKGKPGKSLGDCMDEARQALWDRGSPAGLLYALDGKPSARLTSAVGASA